VMSTGKVRKRLPVYRMRPFRPTSVKGKDGFHPCHRPRGHPRPEEGSSAAITELLQPRQKVLGSGMRSARPAQKGLPQPGNAHAPASLVLQPPRPGVSIPADNGRKRTQSAAVLSCADQASTGAGLLCVPKPRISEDLLIDDLETLLRQWKASEAAEIAKPTWL